MGYAIEYIRIDGRKVGIVGLTDAFKSVQDLGMSSDAQLKSKLIACVRRSNYIPDASEAAYGEGLVRAYRRFLGEDIPDDHDALEIRVYGGD
jgi:hypothetical protein